MAQNIKGPGALWVTSNISKDANNPLDEATFLRWYDEDHISEIVASSGVPAGFRFIHVDKTSPKGTRECPKPFLAFYALPDIAFTQGPEFKKFKVKSDILPGTGICYDMADIDVRYLGLVGTSGKRKGPVTYIIASGIEPAEGVTDEEVNAFFDQQAAKISKVDHYQRSVRFKLLYARTNAQSRALKGLPTTDEPLPEPPTWLALHEFSAEPTSDVWTLLKSDSHQVLKAAKQVETDAYRLDKTHGTGRFFEDGESGTP